MAKTVKRKSASRSKPTRKAVSRPVPARRTKKTEKTAPLKTERIESGLSIPVYNLSGGKTGKVTAPAEISEVHVNKELLAQAVRVYLANQRQGQASTKTRGEVEGSTRKIYRQKGTGRARHGAIRAPIFVGGGITFGPKPHSYHLDLPKKMKRLALRMALKVQFDDGNITVLDGLTSLEPKTKHIARALESAGAGSSVLLVVAKDNRNLVLGARNIEDVDVMPVNEINTYAVLTHQKVVFTKDTVQQFKEIFHSDK